MCEYLEKYFNVTVHPPRLPRTAAGWIGDMSAPNDSLRGNHWQVGWKHLPPLNSENATKVLPSNSLLIQMIREPLAWLKSLVKSHYSLVPASGSKRGGEKVGVAYEYRECAFSNVIDLWACYAHGYLSGLFTAGVTTSLTAIVRHEDLVAYPTKIIVGLASKGLRRKLVNNSAPAVTPIDEYVGGGRGSHSSRELALQAIKRGRFIEPVELRHWVTTRIQRRSTLTGLLGYIPHSYAMMRERPMVWFYSDPDPVRPEDVVVPTPPPPPARGGNAPARGEVMLANAGYVLPSGASVVDWLTTAPGFRQLPVGSSDVRKRDARREPDLMDTTSGRDIVPWQFQDIPPRLVPGLLTYAEVIKRY